VDDEAWGLVQKAWPGVGVTRAQFDAFLKGRDEPCAEGGLGELYIACGCLEADRFAIKAAEAEYIRIVPEAISHMKLSSALVDEVQQEVRTKLLLGTETKPPSIGQYAGQGRLRGFVKITAIRTAISTLRKNKRHEPSNQEALLGIPSQELDPELQVMKATYQTEFAEAFEAAIADLSSRDRNILRLRLVDNLTVGQVSGIYNVDRATVTRWITKVRSTLLLETRKRMQNALGIDSGELDSVMRLIESRLDVSVQRMLQTRDQ
jgi:RNA polymerase sigma-70 factor (ECF subfamily)